ncbi:hypothetical protein SSS_09904 [Sarcoptes scabiei]|nr:hypothetical protein SSS_09904 [Sarcoptes scabiei]
MIEIETGHHHYHYLPSSMMMMKLIVVDDIDDDYDDDGGGGTFSFAFTCATETLMTGHFNRSTIFSNQTRSVNKLKKISLWWNAENSFFPSTRISDQIRKKHTHTHTQTQR